MKKTAGFLLLSGLFVTGLFAQNNNVTVKGTVLNKSGSALANASVVLKGTQLGTSTNNDGKFSLRIPSLKGVLVISYTGYNKLEQPVNGQSEFAIQLDSVSVALEDVVVTGYTTQSKTKVTSAVSKVGAAEFKNTPSANPIAALQGKMAGVSLPITSGQPGLASGNIIIRGGTKVNVYGQGASNGGGGQGLGVASDVNPLIVIDGIFRTRAELNDVNPNDIESIQVMKDAASVAIYGARGANGVVVVKTKGGKYNAKSTVTVSHRSTWEKPSRSYGYLGATDYLTLARTTMKNTYDFTAAQKITYLNQGGFSAGAKLYTAKGQYGNGIYTTAFYDNIVAIEGQSYVDGLLAKGYQTMDDPTAPGTKLLYYDNHYQDLLWKTGLTNDDNISLSGGGDKANYNLSAGYANQAGSFTGTGYKRYNVLGNFSVKANDKVTIDALMNYQNVQPKYVDAFVNDLIRGTRVTPLIRLYKDDGNPQSGESYTVRNWLHTKRYDNYDISTERFTTRVGLNYAIIKGLSFRPSLSYNTTDYKYIFNRLGTPATDYAQPATIRQKNENLQLDKQLMIDQILQYDFTVRDVHHFTTLAGFNYTRNYTNTVSTGSQRATNDYVTTIAEPTLTTVNGVTVSNVTTIGSAINITKSASYFAQLLYDYNARYLFSASMRYDGFSNFAPENKYASFPSLSAGWNIYKEQFFHVAPISLLKLRASWGVAGTSDLAYTDTYGGYGSAQYAQTPGILRTNLANPNLKWEKTEMTDLAIDLGLFKNRITLTVDYYNKLTKNRLDSKPLPSESPFSSIAFNNGTLQNKGIEIELSAEVLRLRDFSWRTNFSFAKNNQKIIKLPANARVNNRQGGGVIADPNKPGGTMEVGGLAEGERPYSVYAYHVLGIFSTEAEAAAWNATHTDKGASGNAISSGIKKHAGDYIFDDVNGDGTIDDKDVVFMGYTTPNITGGWQNTFTYKSLSLRFNVDYATGHIIENGALARSLGQGRAFNEGAPSQALGNDIWQKEGDVGKKYARFSFADADYGQKNFLRWSTVGTNQTYGSDVSTMISKGDFIALRELTLAYDLPKNITRKFFSTGVNVFVSVYNLGYITGYKGFNPESYAGYDPGGYPRPRQYSLGATLKF